MHRIQLTRGRRIAMQSSISPKIMPFTPVQLARQNHLPEHAVDLVRLHVHVFEKEQLAFGLSRKAACPATRRSC